MHNNTPKEMFFQNPESSAKYDLATATRNKRENFMSSVPY